MISIRARLTDYDSSIGFAIIEIGREREYLASATQITMEKIGDMTPIQDVVRMNKDVPGFNAAQTLMDDLWRCGIRPTEGKGSAGQLTAVLDHLATLKDLAESRRTEAATLTTMIGEAFRSTFPPREIAVGGRAQS